MCMQFLVTKLLRLCPAHRQSILLEFQSNVLRLLLHREATSVLADAYELYANTYERTILLRDFYGKEANLFTITRGTDEEKERAKKGLRGVLEGADAERRRRLLNALKGNLTTMWVNYLESIRRFSMLIFTPDSTTPTRAPSLMLSSTAHFGSTSTL